MPVQYEGIIKEHMNTRQKASIFDTCHMGELLISGESAVRDLEYLLSCPISSIDAGACRYGFLCNDSGGVLDDCITYRLSQNEFFIVVNAGTQQSDFEWIKAHLSEATDIENRSFETAKVDLQGPQAPEIMRLCMQDAIDGMKFYRWQWNRFNGNKILVSRTGYTGEIGFEIYCGAGDVALLWEKCIEFGALPAGLGARDTLRLEMGMPLYGHELSKEINPAQTGFSRAIARDKKFIGSEIVSDLSRAPRRLVGLAIEGRRAARNGDEIMSASHERIGAVTSGSFSPCLRHAIALGYVDQEFAVAGTPVLVQVGHSALAGHTAELPFYKNATGRMPLSIFLKKES